MNKMTGVAFDIDGTLLDSQKRLTDNTKKVLQLAKDNGYVLSMLTGRCMSELGPLSTALPMVRYAVCCSGALIYDFEATAKIGETVFSRELTTWGQQMVMRQDLFPLLMSEGQGYIVRDLYEQTELFRISQYRKLYRDTAIFLDSRKKMAEQMEKGIHKLNFYHLNMEEMPKTRAQGTALGGECVYSEGTGVEVTAGGVNKGHGLQKLCQYLKTTTKTFMVIGDAENDMSSLRLAGISVAMGNAEQQVKDLCHITTLDNDHDGCAQAIQRYLLSAQDRI